MTVGLFIPCYVDQFYPKAAIATLKLLQKQGVKVVYPLQQTCCGQPMANSGFEHLTHGCDELFVKNFSQFDWTFGRSEYARLTIDTSRPHSGSRSLKIEFLSRDTTELKDEIRQLVVLRPGARYRLECYVKSEGLAAPEGPRLVVTDKSSNWIAQSDPIALGSNDWKLLSVEFVAPKVADASSAVYISIKRKPKYDYDEPTRGALWFDDFTMKEL